jgi:hypothetical protein
VSSQLSYDERDVLKVILRVGGPNLARNLQLWGEWIHDLERAKIDHQVHPQFPLVVLSLMGIHGREALT